MRKLFIVFAGLLFANCAFSQIKLDTSGFIKNNPNIYGLIIFSEDSIIQESYYNEHNSKSLFNDQSITKSIISLLIGIAIEKKYIKSVDQKLVDFFPQLNQDVDLRKLDITLRMVMNQTSGLYREDLRRLAVYLKNANPTKMVLESPLAGTPGADWVYNNAASHLLSVIITKATNMDTKAFAERFLFSPMEITIYEWGKMRDGYYDGSGLLGLKMQISDLLKVGMMVSNKGIYHNRQVVPAAWIEEITNPKVKYEATWGFPNSTYALCWYSSSYKETSFIYAMGWGGQFIVLIPSLKAVVVVNQSISDRNAIQQSNNFIQHIFPLIYNNKLSLD